MRVRVGLGLSGLSVRDARPAERRALETLQARSSAVWVQLREVLAAHPEVCDLPESSIDRGWVRVAVAEELLGFSVVVAAGGPVHELDGLFVEPSRLRRGIGRVLVDDACARARVAGAQRLEVVAGPAQPFYERLGFRVVEEAATQFGPAVRMVLELGTPPRGSAGRTFSPVSPGDLGDSAHRRTSPAPGRRSRRA